jgi:hypothetical protein
MAEDRDVVLDRAVAAKMLLLEYFMPELFRTLALEAAAKGHSETLASLEEEAYAQDGVSDAGGRTKAAGSTFGAQAAAMASSERFRTWLRVDPPLAAVDLRPYVYFARERYALPVDLAQRLSPAGALALAQLLGDSEAEQGTAADMAAHLPLPEVITIVGQLTTRARASGVDLRPRTSPIHAMVEVAKKRPEVGGDVIATILGIPYETLPAGAAVILASLLPNANLSEAALGALQRLASQDRNPSLKAAAEARIRNLQAGAARTGRR